MTELIATREFSAADLLWFAAASGDWNPIHVDSVQARRTLAGKVVVHGMYSLLWALECHVKTGGAIPLRVQAFFRQPVHPGEQLELRRDSSAGETRLAIVSGKTECASVLLSGIGIFKSAALPSGRPPQKMAEVKGIENIKGSRGSLKISGDAADIQHEFPALAGAMGNLPVAVILTSSRLVGMTSPGLHSLFTGLDLTFADYPEPVLDWHVNRIVSPLAPISMSVSGGGAKGQLSAFIRPAPARQASMTELAGTVSSPEFSEKRALIIGGSRGLGELTAKLLASAGSDVLLSYRTGREDAEKIAADINAAGGNCRCFQFDTSRPETLVPDIGNWQPNLLFYYATPNITKQLSAQFDQGLYRTFLDTYVTSYDSIVTQMMLQGQHSMWALYPSTIFAEVSPAGFAEYAAAKKQGELLCHTLQTRFPKFHPLIERFPRLATDQTLSLIPQKTEPAVLVLRAALNRLAEQIKASRQ
jgi:MaoC like domain/short chain dehydrogenase